MIGVAEETKGGMWTVVDNYFKSKRFNEEVDLTYIPTATVGSVAKRLLFTAKGYMKIIASGKHDILHVHMAEKGSVYRKGIAMSLASADKKIVHMHGATFQDWYESLSDRKKAGVRKILNKADKVIILGKYWEDFISGIVPKEKIEVVYNAVPIGENRYNTESRRILFFGVVGQRKGAYDLLDAFSEIADKFPDVTLAYYGPDFEHRIEEEIEKKHLGDRVQYLGWLKDKESAFSDVMCNVLPSYNEGLPMTILETMAFGIPNISTSVAAIPEVINDENGILIEAGNKEQLKDAMITICRDSELRKRFSENAHKTMLEKFSADKHIEQILDIYQGIAK